MTGFRQAYNVNKVGQMISNGPDEGKPIPNQIPVADWGGSNFGGAHPLEAVMPSDSVIFMTVMGSPLVPTTASEMVRVLDPVKGIVFLYNVSAKGISAFEAACPAGLRLKQVVTDPSELGIPFCEVRGSYFPVRIYGWQGHADHYEFHTDL